MKRTLILGVFFTSLVLLLVVSCNSKPNQTGAGTEQDISKQESTQESIVSESNSPGEFVTEQFLITGFT